MAPIRIRTQVGFWNVRTLHDNGIEYLQNARFLQFDRELQHYRLDIPGSLSEVSVNLALD